MAEYGVLPHWIDIYIISSKQGGRTPRYSTAKTSLCLSVGGGGRPLRGVLVLRGTPLERKNARDPGAEEIQKKSASLVAVTDIDSCTHRKNHP